MKVEITKRDIQKSEQQNCETCVVARALCRLPFPAGTDRVKVNDQEAQYTKSTCPYWEGGPFIRVKLSRQVQQYIRRFDEDKKLVLPTVLSIDVPV